jgi:hypothetical protein
MLDAENFLVTTTEGSNAGVGKNVAGNVLVAFNNFVNAKTHGVGKETKNGKIYYFVKSPTFDYLMEYDVVTTANIVVLQSTSGTRLNLIAGQRITNIDIIIDPLGNGNLILWSGDSNPPRIGNIERMKTWGVDGFTAEEIMLIKAPPTYSPILIGKISTQNTQNNFLENKFIAFSTRYKYKDGHYSPVSSWTKYFFVPKLYSIDFETFENLGMVNSFNAVDVKFNTGNREVVQVDLCFKYSNETNIYIVDKFVKSHQGWADNTIQTVEFNNSKVYSILATNQYFRNFDNVPESAVAQTIIGNRIAYGNFLEGKDLIDINGNPIVMNYTLSLVNNNITNKNLTVSKLPRTYAFQTPSVLVNKAQIDIDFTGVNFNNGNSVVITFRLKSYNSPAIPNRPFTFSREFTFVLSQNYINLQDFLENSQFQNEITVSLQNYFKANGGIVLPSNYLQPYTVRQTFLVSSVGNIMSIVFPIIKYEIDNTPNPNTFIYDYFYDNSTTATFNKIAVATSLKSERSYEIAMIYRDLQVRKTTALVSQKNTIYIDNKFAVTQNIINVNIPVTQLPPVWAKTYKFAIKRNKGDYEIIPINIFFTDGIFRYIKLDGENKNKVHDGDILIVKRDQNGTLSNIVKVKVLEVAVKPENFLTNNAPTLIEPAGLYAKIKASNFLMEYAVNEFRTYTGYDQSSRNSYYPTAYTGSFSITDQTGAIVDIQYKQGSTVTLSFRTDFANEDPRILFNKTYTAQINYANFFDFFTVQMQPNGFISTSHPDKTFTVTAERGYYISPVRTFTANPNGQLWLKVIGTESGRDGDFISDTQYGRLYVIVDTRNVEGLYVFENTAKELPNDIFYETPEIYDVVNGQHQMTNHLLKDTYNCFCQGNGVESYQIRDSFNEKTLGIDFSPTAISEDAYKQVNRFADITYSGIYDSNTDVNKLNEFNLSLGNYKADVEKKYGAIWKLHGKDTDLEVYQEDRDSLVYYGKNILTNVDGSKQLIQTEDVLNQQNTYAGEYGISKHPESIDHYGLDTYHTDLKRGVVIKKSNNGLFEISSQGMRNYFKKLFRNHSVNQILGKYDQFYDYYLLNIKYDGNKFVTWVYSDRDNGWLGRISFNPDDMIRLDNDFYSFINGNIYKHNQEKDGLADNYNTFYGQIYPSKFKFVFNQEPSMRKNFKTISSESTDAWEVVAGTDINKGYIHEVDFEKKENVHYAYLRTDNTVIDTALIGSCQGIGNCTTIVGLTINFAFQLEDLISIGDKILDVNTGLVGTILSKTNNSLTLNTVNGIVAGDFLMCAKPQSIENNMLLGHSMQVEMKLTKTSKSEVFAVNTEVQKSYE